MSLGGGASDALDQAVARVGRRAACPTPSRPATATPTRAAPRRRARRRRSPSARRTARTRARRSPTTAPAWTSSRRVSRSRRRGTPTTRRRTRSAARRWRHRTSRARSPCTCRANPSATPAQVATALTRRGDAERGRQPGHGLAEQAAVQRPGRRWRQPGPGAHADADPEPAADADARNRPRRPAPGCGEPQPRAAPCRARGAEVRIAYSTHRARPAQGVPDRAVRDRFRPRALSATRGATWQTVAISQSPFNTETLEYTGPAGQYRWRVYSYSGSGAFTLSWARP